LIGKFFEREDGRNRTHRNAGTTIYAVVRADEELLGILKARFILAGMNAVNRTNVHAQSILATKFCNYIRHVENSP